MIISHRTVSKREVPLNGALLSVILFYSNPSPELLISLFMNEGMAYANIFVRACLWSRPGLHFDNHIIHVIQ